MELVITRFRDGTTVVAAPVPERDDPLAFELGYESAWAMCAEHDLTHVRLAEPGVSYVLWSVAHGDPLDPVRSGREEDLVLKSQKMGRTTHAQAQPLR